MALVGRKNDRSQTRSFPSETSRFAPLILAHRGSALPWRVDDRAALRLRRIWWVPTRQSTTRLSATMFPASRVPPHFPKGTKLELGRGAHLGTPSSANHTAAASRPTGRIAKAASWLHLSRVSPALHPPERPSHTHTPKPVFGGRRHEVPIEKPETPRVRSCRCYALGVQMRGVISCDPGGYRMARDWRYTKLSRASPHLFWHVRCVIVPLFLLFLFCFVFMLSLEFCRCSSDFFLSSRPRIGLATTYSTRYWVWYGRGPIG